MKGPRGLNSYVIIIMSVHKFLICVFAVSSNSYLIVDLHKKSTSTSPTETSSMKIDLVSGKMKEWKVKKVKCSIK